jgi:hypothetical protein
LRPSRKVLEEKHDWKKPGGNADGSENKGLAKIATQKNMKTRAIKIDGARKTPWAGEEGRDETGTLSAEP